jgi:hypothetical protein
MTPLGFHFEWHDMAEEAGSRVSVELALITFEGRCDTAVTAPQYRRNAGPLGWTHVSDGQILPFTNVSCDRIRAMVQPVLVTSRSEVRSAIYGRALGRVLAHELYHIFGQTVHHGSGGVAKESYSMWDLVNEHFQFGEKQSELLRATRSGPTPTW